MEMTDLLRGLVQNRFGPQADIEYFDSGRDEHDWICLLDNLSNSELMTSDGRRVRGVFTCGHDLAMYLHEHTPLQDCELKRICEEEIR